MHAKAFEQGQTVFWYNQSKWWRCIYENEAATDDSVVLTVDEPDVPWANGMVDRVYRKGDKVGVHKDHVISWWDIKPGDTITSTAYAVDKYDYRGFIIEVIGVPVATAKDIGGVKFKYRAPSHGLPLDAYKQAGYQWDIDLMRPHVVVGWPKVKTESAASVGTIPPYKTFDVGDVVTWYGHTAIVIRTKTSPQGLWLLILTSGRYETLHADLDDDFPDHSQRWVLQKNLTPGTFNGRTFISKADAQLIFPIKWDRKSCPIDSQVMVRGGGGYTGKMGTTLGFEGHSMIVRFRDGAVHHISANSIGVISRSKTYIPDGYLFGSEVSLPRYPDRPMKIYYHGDSRPYSAPQYPLKPEEALRKDEVQVINPVPIPKLVSLGDEISILKPLQ